MSLIYAALLLFFFRLAVAQISRTAWTVTADSFEPGNEPVKAVDNNTATIWHTDWTPVEMSLPHNITIDMKQSYNIESLTYLPRQDGNNNGHIGQHQIVISIDGVIWSSPIAIGTYLDDTSLKTTTFSTVPARYVRLIALTEAGNRGLWTSAAEINVYAASSYTSPSTALGFWGATIDFPLVPAASAMLFHTGNVLVWSSFAPSTFSGGNGGITLTATYDPVTEIVSQRNVSNVGHDMFCPGLSIDANGSPVVTGGNDADKTSLYDPGPDVWVSGPNMQIPRGYQAQVTLSDGRIFTIGGSWNGGEGGKNGEIFSEITNLWTLLPGCPVAPMLTNDSQGVYRQDNHGWLFGWKNGSVFQAGPSRAMNWYGTAGNGSQAPAGPRASDTDSMNGNAVMFDAFNGKILTVGGAPNYQNSYATANAHIITIGTPGVPASVATIGPMAYTRAFANAVVLPDGTVFVTGGQAYAVPFTDSTAVMYPELWNPTTGTFTVLSPMAIPRTYHSWALLLLDGTIINGGGGLCGACTTNHYDAEIYTPAYLLNSDGSPATRPKITSVSASSVVVGGRITVVTNMAVTQFSLIRYGSATHTVDTDQRRIALTPAVSGTTSTIAVPGDAGIALPGYWMLFALTAAGVPSVASTVLIKGS
ncbi:hypothetical protein MMC13_005695 [Lambiella insularis]|nr:hypothetical protein [Lambiella insularis]